MATIGGLTLVFVDERARLGHLTGRSVPNYRNRLWRLAEYVGTHEPITRLTTRRIERWLLSLDVATSTRRVYLSTVRSWTAWLVSHRHLKADPAANLERPRQPYLLPPRALSVEVVQKTYVSCPDIRAEMIVTLMVQQGLRAAEVASIELGDIDRDARVLTVRGKGGHERALPITTETEAMLRRYLASGPKATAGPLIRSHTNPRAGLKAATVSGIMARVMHDAGVGDTGHSLRHTCASDMLERGVHVRTVQHVLGHKSLATTQRYLRRWVGDLRDAMEGRDYRP